MNARMNNRILDAQFALILMSTRNLINDRRPLLPPVRKAATATIAEILASKKAVN
jgi:hypothetical protein